MKNNLNTVFEVTYKELIDDGDGGKPNWIDGGKQVLLAKNAEDAIARVRKKTVGVKWGWDEGGNSRRFTAKTIDIEINEVTQTCELTM